MRHEFPRGIDCQELFRQLKRLPVFRDCPRSIARTKLKLVYPASGESAWAHDNRLVRMRVTEKTSRAWILETMLHELVHAALPRGTAHNARFHRTLIRAAWEAWSIAAPPDIVPGRTATAAIDSGIEAVLMFKLADGLVEYPTGQPPTPEERAAIAAARRMESVEKRAAHAARMLAVAETRVRRAKTLEQKWRSKVRRYERIAAKGKTKEQNQ